MLLWFRNDLRSHDNPALQYFLKNNTCNTPLKAVFFISEPQWLLHDWSTIKIDFIKRHAAALVEELAPFNIKLDLVNVDSFGDQIAYLRALCEQEGFQEIVANSEVEFNEQQRDNAIVNLGIKLTLFEADVIVPKGKVINLSHQMYKVFTPFKRAWLTYVKQHGFDYLGKLQSTSQASLSPTVQSPDSISAHWPLVHEVEKHVLPLFFAEKISDYHDQRDIPSIKGTSGLSPYLAAGVISPRYVLMSLINAYPDILIASDSEEFSWLNEIIWREFYRNLMFHEQRLCKHQCFNEKYQAVAWHYNDALFDAWCQGKTGYPLVDAAMRQLNQTGWMHNRLRMVVASFLTKHLLIDWRLGEKYFMSRLIDGDLASNNGGWQWAASTGCDAQPYFRIFNPIRQSERFDPKGHFIRKYLPELASVPDKNIHFPHTLIEKNKLNIYWPPVVDHKEARLKALAFYKV
ncbi:MULTISPECIES: deoxyribodipyrimidine photo-lyase [unclassified Colwellia]|uniref:deoxyribodipyrimidine photo-lyase n=1 Tax=unclassified Colwellia TaxID=196834 RepID=UPI0015F56835|nr:MULTISPECIES: deoxyribodipyrimidine photo-lyase [unclassified Colwellia]MBA6254495.1 deoxyribodipyrimidine photo-lyase [Colwellia sp. MB3u-28]MBA6259192.1 deoxyribodipyrimidine photo-lyase [Colwellia sp. MB3u-41]